MVTNWVLAIDVNTALQPVLNAVFLDGYKQDLFQKIQSAIPVSGKGE
jgi:hypothetical protein